jgi:SAM-dependent methyltransferase
MTTSSNEKKHQNLINKFFLFFYWRKLIGLLRLIDFSRAVEVGCGEGYGLVRLREKYPSASWQGLDLSPRAVEQARARNKDIPILTGDVRSLPYPDNSFDLVLCLEVLEHLRDFKLALEEIVRVASKYIIISVPREPWFSWGSLLAGRYLKFGGRHPEHVNFWSPRQIVGIVANQSKIKAVRKTLFWTIILAVKE